MKARRLSAWVHERDLERLESYRHAMRVSTQSKAIRHLLGNVRVCTPIEETDSRAGMHLSFSARSEDITRIDAICAALGTACRSAAIRALIRTGTTQRRVAA